MERRIAFTATLSRLVLVTLLRILDSSSSGGHRASLPSQVESQQLVRFPNSLGNVHFQKATQHQPNCLEQWGNWQESVIVMAEWNVDLEVIAMDGIPGGSHRSPFANANKPLMPRRGCGGPRMQVCWHATYAIEGMPLRGWELAASLCASLSDHLSTHQTPYSAINHPPPSRSMFASYIRFWHSCQRNMSNVSKYSQNSLWVNICLHSEVEGWC